MNTCYYALRSLNNKQNKTLEKCSSKWPRSPQGNPGVWKYNLLLGFFLMYNHIRIGGVTVSVFALRAVDCEFESRSGQAKDYDNGMCCFSAKHTALRKSKDMLTRMQDNVSEWGDMPICGLLFQWASIIKIQLSVLV